MELLNKVAWGKTKFLRTNHSRFVTKEGRKTVMLKTKLGNSF